MAAATSTERTPLLAPEPVDEHASKSQGTPLPWKSVSAVLFARLTEPISMSVIFPFVAFMIQDTGVPPSDVGYKAGLIESLFTITQFCVVLQIGRLSDRIGRKPVIIMGLLGCSASVIAFGFSRTFLAMVLSRLIAGATNANTGAIKSALGELTDSTNEAKAFTLLVPAYTAGQVLGPVIGGFLADPAERFPRLFGNVWLFQHFKYLLPCLVAALFPLLGILAILFFFEETLPDPQPVFGKKATSEEEETAPLVGAVEAPPTVQETLTPRVRRILLNYAILAFTSMAIAGMISLFMYTPIELGGVGFSEAQIGTALSAQAVATVLIQLVCYAPMQTRIGTIGAFRAAAVFYPLAAAMFPVVNFVARQEAAAGTGDRTWTWVALSVLLGMLAFANLTYSGNMILINAAAPSQRSLGTLNGISAMLASFVRSAALAGAPSLFAFSINKHLLGGQAVWIFIISCGVGLVVSSWTIKDAKAAWRD